MFSEPPVVLTFRLLCGTLRCTIASYQSKPRKPYSVPAFHFSRSSRV
jgi:hypothetical protein